ncbi:receptor activity-modifying protein 2 isoform X2 [Seriola lalandi dorsalis]|uniref:receptor activity-modifying protein 2 isoform X2 n=1 Tax=Seriola lalandi dorsalis TaxID=1841481 RepID=UPI000C6F5320|nr:receptor activity-modifying protein 2 isoform X2 [Seriola lalandi dorsalis]XP_056258546.1 receptor activity-modifying protein 2 isoform X2 [Seriola aureovittata]
MTATSFSLMFSGCFMTVLIWGCTTVDGLVDEQLAVQPATTTKYHSTDMMTANATYGESALKFACGNISHSCMYYCNFCNDIHGAPTMGCLSILSTHLCLRNFESAMASLNSTDWCIWDNVRGLYSNLSLCTEDISDCLLIPWPNPLVEETFVNIHAEFFKDCPTEELSDPPPVIVFALVITPICLIPVMVSLVVLKTKNGDGSS